jgi:hypothetical protein
MIIVILSHRYSSVIALDIPLAALHHATFVVVFTLVFFSNSSRALAKLFGLAPVFFPALFSSAARSAGFFLNPHKNLWTKILVQWGF